MAVLGYPRTLKWVNFGTPVAKVPKSYQGTHTDCHIDIDISYTTGGTIKDADSGEYSYKDIKVTVKVNALHTWVLKGVPTGANQAAILNHEQGHYDIAGLAASDLDSALSDLSP